MSRVLLMSDLHLGHRNIHKYRTQFQTAEEHHEVVWDNLASNVMKRDHIVFLGDVAFTHEWLEKIKTLKVAHKTLVCGNHDLERGIHMNHLVAVYDQVYALWNKRNFWFSHAPIHPMEIRGKLGVIHGHLHDAVVDDPRYLNVCLEHTEYKPITFEKAMERFNAQQV